MLIIKKAFKWVLIFTAGCLFLEMLIRFLLKYAWRGLDNKPGTRAYPWRYGKVRYTVYGKGEPLLLVHGLGKGAGAWDAYIPALAKHYRVYVLDLPGFGQSDAPAITYSAYLYSALLRDFIREAVGCPVMVMAEGHGGLYAVKAHALTPGYIEKLILFNLPEQTVTGKSWAGRAMACPVIGTAVYYFVSLWILLFEKQYTSLLEQGPRGQYVLGAWLSGLLDTDITEDLSRIKIPVKIIRGQVENINHYINLLKQE
jgi:pimeloyl-ACP methyl ester carboxylesterase